MKRLGLGVALALLCSLLGVVGTPSTAEASTTVKTVWYGPFTVPGGTMADPGMIHNRLLFGVKRPCSDCYITSFTPDLVYGTGTRATMDTGMMLHHTVFTSQWRSDATCSGNLLGLAGERFFASGNERTAISFPSGYGYRVRWYDSWNMLVDLMNHSTQDQTVYIKVTYTVRPSWESVQRLKPVWLDIDQCGDSEYNIPAGYSDTHWNWWVNVPGKLVAMLGHVHGYGLAVEATNESQGGKSLCRSNATLDPMDPTMVMEMSTCTGNPIATLHQGDLVRLHSMYDSPVAENDVMGIMLGYINPS